MSETKMTLWQRLRGAWRVLQGYHPSDPGLRRFWGGGRETTSGQIVDEKAALSVAAYFACVRVISEDIAKLPFQVYEEGTARKKATKHPVNRILHVAANQEVTAMSFRESVTADALTMGNGYGEIVRNGRGQAAELHYIDPFRVRVFRQNGLLMYEVRNQDGSTDEFETRDFFHLKGVGPNSIVGWSIATLAAECIGFSLAQQQFGAAFYGNSAAPNAAIELPESVGKVDRDSIKDVIKDWEDRFQGPGKAGRVGVLLPGWQLKTYSISPKDSEFIEGRQFTVEEWCRWFRVAPHKVQHLLRSTNNNIEHQGLEHVTDTLQPWAKRWEQEADRKLFTASEEGDLYTKHNFEALLRGDSKSRSQFYRELFGIGVYTQNMILDKEDEPLIGPEGDRRYVPLNMIPVDLVDQWITSKFSAGQGIDQNGDPATDPLADPKTDPAEDPKKPTKSGQQESVGRCLRAMLAESLDRMIRKEAAAAKTKAAKPKEFEAWAIEFYEKHEANVRDAIKSVCRGFVTWSPDCLYGGSELAELIAAKHCERSKQDLDRAQTSTVETFASTVESIVNEWHQRAATEAAEFFEGVSDASGTHELAV